MGPTLLQSLEEKDNKKNLIGLKIYVLPCTLYVCRNVHLGFLKIFIQDVLFCSVQYSELCLAGISQKSQPPPPIPPKKSIGARPYGFKYLYLSKKPATVTQQLKKSIDFRQIELYDFHLSSRIFLVYEIKYRHRVGTVYILKSLRKKRRMKSGSHFI